MDTDEPIKFVKLICIWIGLATAYWLAGCLGLMLAIPPGYATTIWPSSGIALAAVIIFGIRIWPGIFLGSIANNLITAFDTASLTPLLDALWVSVPIGLGASLQAVLGGIMVGRRTAVECIVDTKQSLYRLLILGGPVACLINATVGSTNLYLSGAISWAEVPFTWVTWWIGDTIGVLIFAPLILLWTRPNLKQHLRRLIIVTIPLLISFCFAVFIFSYVSQRENERLQEIFDDQMNGIAEAIDRTADSLVEATSFISTFYRSSQEVTADEFESFVTPLLSRYQAIQAITYCPRSEAHFGAAYIEPDSWFQRLNSFDLAQYQELQPILEWVRDSGETAASGPIPLPSGEADNGPLILFLQPIYDNDAPIGNDEQRRKALQGYACCFVSPQIMVTEAVGYLNTSGIYFEVYEQLPDGRQRILLACCPVTSKKNKDNAPKVVAGAKHDTTLFSMAYRPWNISLLQTPEYVAAHRHWYPWLVVAGGLFFTCGLGAVLMLLTAPSKKNPI